MKNVNQNPADYSKAIKTGQVETASMDYPRTRCTKIVNCFAALQKRGIVIPAHLSGELADAMLTEIEKRGIHVPGVPIGSLEKIEVRSFVNSFEGKTEGIQELFPPAKEKYKPSDREKYLKQLQKYYKGKKL